MEQSHLNWIANFIWGIADDVLRDLYVRGKYRDVILPMTVLCRLDAVLEPTKQAVLDMKVSLDNAKIVHQDQALRQAAGQAFYNTSKFTLRLLSPDINLSPKLSSDKKPLGLFLGAGSPMAVQVGAEENLPLIPDIAGITKKVRDEVAKSDGCAPLLEAVEGHFKTDGRNETINADDTRGEHPLFIPYWALSFDELLRVTPFRGLSDADRAVLVERIKELKLASLQAQLRDGVTADTMTVDTPVPFSIHRLWYELHRYVLSTHTAQSNSQSPVTEAIELGRNGQPMLGDIMGVNPPKYRPTTAGGPNRVYLSGASLNIRRELTATQSLLRDTRYDFMFRPGPWCPMRSLQNLDAQPAQDLDTLMASWVGGDKPITILDLSGVPVSILIDLVGVLIRLLSDSLFWARYMPEGGRTRPLLFVLEEAHAYLNAGNKGSASIAAVSRIVKEGRKYGLGAMIVSQRPAEIDPTILSQCGTILAMRLANATDRSHVTATVSDNLEGLFNMLPTLRTGEVIIVGEAVHLPLRALVDAPAKNRRPDSLDPRIYDAEALGGWNRQRRIEDYSRVLEQWRSENSREARKPGGQP